MASASKGPKVKKFKAPKMKEPSLKEQLAHAAEVLARHSHHINNQEREIKHLTEKLAIHEGYLAALRRLS